MAKSKKSKKVEKGKKAKIKASKQEIQNQQDQQLLEAAQQLSEQNKLLTDAIMSRFESRNKGKKKGKKKGRQKDAKAMPTSFRKMYESEENLAGQDKARKMKSSGDARESLDRVEIDLVDRPISKAKLEQIAFGEEYIKVIVHETGNETDPDIPWFQNAGDTMIFYRGKEVDCKRKFVEQLAGCVKKTFTHAKRTNERGEDYIEYMPHSTLAYPFLVIDDPNPRGREWLRSIQQRD